MSVFEIYSFVFARKIFRKWNRGLLELSLRGLGVLNFQDETASGERHFLVDVLGKLEEPVVFDVGANEGNYAKSVLELKPSARVYAFEPHPVTYGRLAALAVGPEHLVAVNAACGSTAGQMVLYDYAGSEGTQHASLHAGVIEGIHHGTANRHDVGVIALDSFVEEHNISHIDLLKIDTEGHELDVLKGTKKLLGEGRIHAVQFEFNEMNVVSRVFLKDFYDLMPQFEFYRTLRDGLMPLGKYSALKCEVFAFQNIVALPRKVAR
jgi:FkbM family methyltransferase